MFNPEILIVGAGLAGVAAATELARAGHPVLIVDRAARAGGAIHRQPLPGQAGVATAAARWNRLIAEAEALPIRWAFETRFNGVDHQGTALLTGAENRMLRPKALILTTGAREAVRPRPGWTLPGVTTAGAAQIQLKTMGAAPQGRVVLAGSGPLLIALGAQMTRLKNPPVAIVEAGRPFAHPLTSLRLPLGYLREAAGYMATLLAARVPILTGTRLAAIRAEGETLVSTLTDGNTSREIVADMVCLHDGIRRNDIGLTDCPALSVLRLGDCAEALGARAALEAGRAGGRAMAQALATGTTPTAPNSPLLDRERAAQARLARIYAHDDFAALHSLPSDTVICRCEGRTLDDLRALGPAPRTRELRLLGRFGMGPCQGRFCGEWVARAISDTPQAPVPAHPLGEPRWPAAPIAVADLHAAAPDTGAAPPHPHGVHE
ncbi:NAD(P)/FAD-dependent oxidoreductase [Sinirhodobacter sp. WL0062]|uniref:NAD(P)/FAD-dependent oxidoreductase n=1 Tax=Rhodobacter flavimaris TaxID=2907145 RepID=A0ABS8YYV3_9RHOB|nr:FAD/NAD(P)-binding oxidoreductase [Sinirhodobacter sp. WL0062]MCE5974971.1 NAD(P)/FAD-dependent oxidoreductase [Sinirhodobacter sp. WL0062]